MKKNLTIGLALAVILALVLSTVALADQIVNNIDTSIDPALELTTIAPGGNAVVGFYVVASNTIPSASDANGCNATGSNPAFINLSVPDNVSASPNPVKIVGCETAVNVTFSSTTVGSYDIAIASVSGGKPGSLWDTAPASFTLKVVAPPPPDSTPPDITPSIVGTLGNNGWYVSDVTLSWLVSDDQSSVSSTNGCDPVTITSDQDATDYTCTAVSAGGSKSVTVTIKRDATKPTATATATPGANGNGWNNTDVTVSFSGTDDLSGIDFCTEDQLFTNEGANQLASGTCTDKAGNESAPATATVNIDKTAPTASASASPAPNANGWNNTNVTVSFTGQDEVGGSGIASCSTAVVLSSEGMGQSASGTCTDKAGNVSAAATASGINIDKTAPTASASVSPAANANGWNNTNVTVSFSGNDGLSGIASCSADVVLSSEGAGQSASGTCTDKAGNVSAAATASGINIDKTGPALNITGAASGSSDVCSALPTRPTFAPTDALSGVDTQGDSWATPTTPSGVGGYTYVATATDKAGNTTSETRTYTVTYGAAFSGYLQPINSDGSSRFKLGSTVPVKFQLKCGGISVTNATAWLYVAKGDSVPDPGVDEAISTAASTTGNLFRYDNVAQQYIFNLSTKLGYTNPVGGTVSFATGTWTLKIRLDDGLFYSVNVQLPK